MFSSDMKIFRNARSTGVRARRFNATTTTAIRQPRSQSARQELAGCTGLPFSADFNYISMFLRSYDFGMRGFVKLLPVCASPSPLFDDIMQANNALKCTKMQDFKLENALDVIDAGRGKEQGPPLDPRADQELMSADVRPANKAAIIASAGMWSPDELPTAVLTTAAYPTTRCRKVNYGQVRIVTDLPENDSTAQRWAAHGYESHTPAMMGDLPAAAACRLVGAAEPKPQPAALSALPAWVTEGGSGPGGGRGRDSAGDRIGGMNPLAVEQVSGPGADAALGRAQ